MPPHPPTRIILSISARCPSSPLILKHVQTHQNEQTDQSDQEEYLGVKGIYTNCCNQGKNKGFQETELQGAIGQVQENVQKPIVEQGKQGLRRDKLPEVLQKSASNYAKKLGKNENDQLVRSQSTRSCWKMDSFSQNKLFNTKKSTPKLKRQRKSCEKIDKKCVKQGKKLFDEINFGKTSMNENLFSPCSSAFMTPTNCISTKRISEPHNKLLSFKRYQCKLNELFDKKFGNEKKVGNFFVYNHCTEQSLDCLLSYRKQKEKKDKKEDKNIDKKLQFLKTSKKFNISVAKPQSERILKSSKKNKLLL